MQIVNGYRRARIAVIGPKGNGKTCLVPSLLRTLAMHFSGAVVEGVNTEAADATGATALHVGAEPSKPGTREKALVRFDDLRIILEVSVWPAEDLLFARGMDVPRLVQALAVEGVDLIVIVANTFQHDHELAAYSYLELGWNIQKKTGLSLGSVSHLASNLLFSTVREEDFEESASPPRNGAKSQYAELRALNAGFRDITDAQLRDGRLVRADDAKFGLPIHECFRIDGCDDGPQIINVLTRTAQTIGANPIELLNMRGLAARNPERVIVAAVRADLLKFLPGVGELEFTRSLIALFPSPKRVTLGQIVPQASLDLHIGSPMSDRAWLKNASDRAKPLIESILDRCRDLRSTLESPARSSRLSRYFSNEKNHHEQHADAR